MGQILAVIPRPRGGRWSARPVLAAVACVISAACLTYAAEPDPTTEIRWKEINSGERELAPGGSWDLDFSDPKASDHDMQFEPWEGGFFWAPRRGATAKLVGAGDFASYDMASVDPAALSRDRIPLISGSSPAVDPGTIIVSFTTDGHYAKISIDSCAADTLKFHFVTYERQTFKKAPPPGALVDPPALKTPPEGVTFEHTPRDLLLAWGSVRGAATYDLEIDCKCCTARKDLMCSEAENGGHPFLPLHGLKTTAHYTIWAGAYPGRWRVRGVGANGQTGPWSAWTNFNFSK